MPNNNFCTLEISHASYKSHQLANQDNSHMFHATNEYIFGQF